MKVDPSGRNATEDRLHLGVAIAGFVMAAIGAGLLLTTPGAVFTFFGAIGFALATGDAVLAGVHLVETRAAPTFFDHQASPRVAAGRRGFAHTVFAAPGSVLICWDARRQGTGIWVH